MEYILLICILPLLWAVISKFVFPRKISVKEMLIQCAVTFIVVASGYYLSKANLISATEILNGQITAKNSERVSCEHSYECHCHRVYDTDSGGRRSSHRECDTCYEHSYDVDWNVTSTVGEFTIDRVDRQGLFAPPRWSQIARGEPASKSISYKNYVKGAKFSLFNFGELANDKRFATLIPAYPQVYDYYRINRVLALGLVLPDQQSLNALLNDQLRILGPQKQANVILVVVNTAEPSYRYALERAWIGGEKNDIIVIIGMTEYPKIAWVDTITLAKDSGNELLQVKMRDELLALQTLDNPVIVTAKIASVISTDFHRKHMKDLKYLEAEIQPSMTAMMILYIVTVLLNVGLTWCFYNNEV